MGVNENIAAKYDAFISYRHSELDKYVAQTLQKKLENYKVPKSVLKGKQLTKTKIERVFRDQDELPLASNLSEPIEAALKVSDFLIVICSPRLPLSEWCKKEIETFIGLNGRERVLAVLCEGEPVESFPEALVKEKIVTIDENGKEVVTEKNIEPLAADVRGKTKKEINKLIDDAVLRITAAVLGINYDDLKQRHKEQRFKRMLSVSAAIAAFFLVFSLVSTFLLIKINRQSNQILEQNNQIKEQNAQIVEQSDVIKEQYIESRKKIAAQASITAHKLMAEGRRKDALYAILSVAPDTQNGSDDKPYITEVEKALSEIVQPYASLYSYVPEECYSVENGISYYKISDDGKYLAIVDKQNNLFVYDTELQKKVYESQDCYSMDSGLFFVNNTALFYNNNEDGGHIVKLDDNSDINTGISVCDSHISPTKDMFILADLNEIYRYDSESLEKIDQITRGEKSFTSQLYYIDSDIICEAVTDEDGKNTALKAVSLQDGSELWKTNISGDSALVHASDADYWYLSAVIYEGTYENVTTYLYCIDKKTGKIKWSYAKAGMYIQNLRVRINDEGTTLFANSTTKMYAFDGANGELLLDQETSERIVGTMYSLNSSFLAAITADGVTNTFSLDNDYRGYLDYFAVDPEIPIKSVVVRPSMLYVEYRNRNYISLLKLPAEESCKELSDYAEKEAEAAAKRVEYNRDGLKAYDGDAEQPYAESDFNTFNVADIIVSEDCKYAFVEYYDGQITILDMSDLSEKKVIYKEERSYINRIIYDENLKSYVVFAANSFIMNSDFEIVANMGKTVEYSKDSGKLIIEAHGSYGEYDYVDYETLVKKAKDLLGDYVPGEEVISKYSLQ